jgi:predicted nucleic acid-binding protein
VIVVDASAVLDLLLRTVAAAQVESRLFEPSQTLHAPHLLDLEIAQVVRRYERAGHLTAERGAEALADYAALPIRRYPHTLLLERIWELRANLTAYDGAYVALAEALAAPLVTRDKRLAAARGHRAVIELV